MATRQSPQLGNMRGQTIRKVGKPKQGTDALTWALPSYTTTERDALIPETGMIIFNETTLKLNFYDSTTWRVISST